MDHAAPCHYCISVGIQDNYFGHDGTAQELSYGKCANLFHTECSTCPPRTSQELLCAACKHLKLHHLLFCNAAWWKIPVGTLEDIRAVRNCAFHRLLLLAAQAFIDTMKIPELLAKALPFRLSAVLRLRDNNMASLRLELVQDESGGFSNTLTVRRVTEELETLMNPRQCFVPSQIDFERLANLSNICKSSHSKCKPRGEVTGPLGTLPIGFRVIDVQERRLTPLPEAAPFVALSYVWGTQPAGPESVTKLSNVATYERAGELSAAILPNVVEQALQACLRLHERFLWVDRFCIVQDDDIGKAEHIGSMANIFTMATFTLIIACGDGMNVQLPGLREKRHVTTGCAEFDGLQIRSNLPSLLVSVRASTWYSRGWTYQEGVLASRKLFITPTQAIWMCPQHIIYEEPHENKMYGIDEAFEFQTCLKDFQLLGPRSGRFQAYVAHSSLYNERSLSYASDIYKAFSGIGHALFGRWELFDDHVYGLPVTNFDAALLWHPAKSSPSNVRRSDQVNLPGWSWASVSSALRYLPFFGSLVRWQLAASDHDGHVVRKALNADRCHSFLSMSLGSSSVSFRTWHDAPTTDQDKDDDTISYSASPCYSMVLALSHDCLESVLCDDMKEMLEDLSVAEFNHTIQLRWPEHANYYAEAFWYGSVPVVDKPVPGNRVPVLETRAQIASMDVTLHGPHTLKRCRFTGDWSWWNILAPDQSCIGLMRPVPILRGALSNGRGGIRSLTVIAISVGTLDWWREECLEFHRDTNEKFGPSPGEYCTEPQAHDHPEDKECNFKHRGPVFLLPLVPAVNVMAVVWGGSFWHRVSVGCILLDEWAKLDRQFEDIQLC